MLWLSPPVEAHPLLAGLGPEPFSAEFDAGLPLESHAPPRRCDQACADGQPSRRRCRQHLRERVVVPGRHPARRARPTNSPRLRLERLVREVRATLADAIAKGGSTLRDYVDSRGEPGYFQLDYAVYGRAGVAVPRLRRRHQAGAFGRTRNVFLSSLPALTRPKSFANAGRAVRGTGNACTVDDVRPPGGSHPSPGASNDTVPA